MEATNKIQIVRVEIVRDFDKSYYANLYDENGVCHNLSKEYTDFRTLKTLCKKEYGVNLPNLSQIGFETHGRKSYAYISTATPQISTEAAETVNVSGEGEKEAERAICDFISKAETTLNKIKQKCLNREIYVEDADRYEFMVCMAVSNFVNKHKNCSTEPPQSPETPQVIEYTTNTSKPRETARKRPNRAIGSKRTTRRDTLRDTLRPVTYVPRECSTAEAAYW